MPRSGPAWLLSANVTLGRPLNLSEAPVPLLHRIYQEDVLLFAKGLRGPAL